MRLSPPEQLIVDALNREYAQWPSPEPDGFSAQFLEASGIQSTHALLYDRLKQSDSFSNWPVAVKESLRREAQRLAAVDLIRRRELTRVLDTLANANIRPLLLKGAAVAYSHYSSPSLRTRNDTDLLIRDQDRALTDELLLQLEYVRPPAVRFQLLSYASMYRKVDEFGVSHILDVHTRVSNAQCFAWALPFEELDDQAVTVNGFCANARALTPVHALLMACVHRAAHMPTIAYYNGDDPYALGNLLIWLYDIHLLANGMSANEWRQFADLAMEKKLRFICLDALRAAAERFHTRAPDDVVALLSTAGTEEVSAAYLSGSAPKIALAEIKAIPGIPLKRRYIRERLFPPLEYIRQMYGVSSSAWLPFLYVHRALNGISKLLGLTQAKSSTQMK